MKQNILLAFIALLCVGAAAGWNTLNPPPVADYEIVYFGSTTCGICKSWKAKDLESWRADPISKNVKLHMADVKRGQNPWAGGYGKYDDIFKKTYGKKRSIGYPSFVLLKDGEVDRMLPGYKGWNKATRIVRANEKRRAKQSLRQGEAG